MRHVYLENLPHNRTSVNWINSIGCTIKFTYDDIEGTFIIEDYIVEKQQLTVSYDNKNYNISTGHLKECKISIILGLRSKFHKYNIGEVISLKYGSIKITDQILIFNTKDFKGYTYECLSCGNIDKITESNIKRGRGCPVCVNRKVKIGFNDIWTTHPGLAKLLANPDDGYKYTQGSSQQLDWKCPDCDETIRNRTVRNVYKNRLICPKCSDGISYPEKLMYNVLLQLKINFKKEKSFKWSEKKRYDFYIKDRSIIIEMHGMQHYDGNGFICLNNNNVEEEQINDILKEQLAVKNGIRSYITIDARYSDLHYIQHNILNSDIVNFFDLSMIDWLECHRFASSSFVPKVCELWNNGMSLLEICKELSVGKLGVRTYLKQGALLSWCDYSAETAEQNRLDLISTKVICITTNKTFGSILEASKYYNVDRSDIGRNCKNKCNYAGKCENTGDKLIWMYLEDYTQEDAINKICSNTTNSNKHKVPVVQIDINTNLVLAEYISTADAERETGVYHSNITRCCNGGTKLAGGFKWMHKYDYNKMLEANSNEPPTHPNN